MKYGNFLYCICISRNNIKVIHERNIYNAYIQCHFSRITRDEKDLVAALHMLKDSRRMFSLVKMASTCKNL